MKELKHAGSCLAISVLLLFPVFGFAQNSDNARPAKADNAQPPQERDGKHDFDFLFGKWKSHQRRLLHPLTGSNEWAEFDATVVARPILGGAGNMDEFEADTPTSHISGVTVRIYNSKSHQWSIYWGSQGIGALSLPATVGQFKDGRGEFYDQEDYDGKSIFVRYLWIASPDAPRWEQAFSTDGGKTWETNWVGTFTRDKS
ncbi:MAG TPA: hypothetical protein VKZ53_28870 [Candidatus Angelobacter sp.]|nr:hypothetical protein [Candidatus Angelobacter sp.]